MAGEVPELPVGGLELRRVERGRAWGAGGNGKELGIELERSEVGVESSATAVLLDILLEARPPDGVALEAPAAAKVWDRRL